MDDFTTLNNTSPFAVGLRECLDLYQHRPMQVLAVFYIIFLLCVCDKERVDCDRCLGEEAQL